VLINKNSSKNPPRKIANGMGILGRVGESGKVHPGRTVKKATQKFVNKTNADMGVDKVLQKLVAPQLHSRLIELPYTLDCPLNG